MRLSRLEISPTELSYFFPVYVEEMSRAGFLFHRAVHQVLEFGQIDGVPFYTSEDPESTDLRSLLAECRRQRVPMPIPCALFIAREIAAGLAYAHGRRWATGESLGVLHGALLPQEVSLSAIGEVKVSGFGLFRALNRVALLRGFVDDTSVEYLSPESVARTPPDGRSDVYGCAALLYAMLTFRTPRESALVGKPSPPSSLRARVSPDLDALCALALADAPAARPFDAASLEEELTRLLHFEAPFFSSRDLTAFVAGLRDGSFARSLAAKRKNSISSDPRREPSAEGEGELDIEVSFVGSAPMVRAPGSPSAAPARPGPVVSLAVAPGAAVAAPPAVVDRPIVSVGVGVGGPRFATTRGSPRAAPSAADGSDHRGWRVAVGMLLGLLVAGGGFVALWFFAETSTNAPAVVPVPAGGASAGVRLDGGVPFVRRMALEPLHVVESVPPEPAPTAAPAVAPRPPPGPVHAAPAAVFRPKVFATGGASASESELFILEATAPPSAAPTSAAPSPAEPTGPLDAVVVPPAAQEPERQPAAEPRTVVQPSEDGYLTLTSDLWAQVTIDGVTQVTTPLRRTKLRAGHHTIVLHNPDNELTKTIELEITAGQTTTEHVTWDN